MEWNKIDLFPSGHAGIEAKWLYEEGDLVCFVGGSDHWVDWLHHFLPGSAQREAVCGLLLAATLRPMIKEAVFIGGHSLGGSVASLVGQIFEDEGEEVYTFAFGGKRPLKGCEKVAINYRHRGDFVPFLPFWRKRYRHEMKIGKWMPFWKAHGPSTYYEAMETYGFK